MRRTTRSKTERGAALILALLVMLVLSGLALVAMYSVSDSTMMAGMHRMQTEVETISDGYNQVAVHRAGVNAPEYVQILRERDDGKVVELSDGDVDLGGYFSDTFPGDGNHCEMDGGGFSASATRENRHPSCAAVYRDSVMGPRVPGFGDDFCFNRVTVGSMAMIGDVALDAGADSGEAARSRLDNAQVLGRNATQAMIGPVECN